MINDLTLVGRVGKKDVRTIKDNKEMATIYLATYQKWTDKNGQRQEKTTWHNVNFFDKLADFVGKYVQIGSMVYIKGVVNHKPMEDGDKKGQWFYSVTAKEIQIIPTKEATTAVNKPVAKSAPKQFAGDYDDGFNDQIPF